MTRTVNIAQAKAILSELVSAAERGEQILIARGGKPAVRLAPVAASADRRPGQADGLLDHWTDADHAALVAPLSDDEIDRYFATPLDVIPRHVAEDAPRKSKRRRS